MFGDARVIKASTATITPNPGASFTMSAKFSSPGIEGNVRLIKAHGNTGVFTIPGRNPDFAKGVAGASEFIDARVSVQEFAEFTEQALRRHFGSSDGALLLGVCGGSRAGAISNAQNLANAMQKTIYAYPSWTTFTILNRALGMSRTNLVVYGAPWFPKFTAFSPTVPL
jgi:hypothetical protein